jgi:hypothetical protein
MPFLKTNDITTTIYEYNRGDKIVKVDPAIVWRKMNVSCRRLGETFDQLMVKWNETVVREEDTPEDVDRKALLFADLEPKIETMARDAFDIPPLDEEGHGGTVALVLTTLNDFMTEREKKSENTENSPSSSPSTAGDHPDSSKESSGSNV